MAERRVVITGVGAVSPAGTNVSANVAALESGRSFATKFEKPLIPQVQFAGQIMNINHNYYLTDKEQRENTKDVWYCWEAVVQALMDRGIIGKISDIPVLDEKQLRDRPKERNPLWVGTNYPSRRVKLEIGSAVGGSPSFLDEKRTVKSIFRLDISQLLGFLQEKLDIRGENQVRVDACASSIIALGNAYKSVKRGEADLVLAGGAEAPFCFPAFFDFNRMKSLSTRNDAPYKASRPLDRERDGYVMGEGSFMFTLEEYKEAKKRGARIYGEIIGYAYVPDTSGPFGANRYATRNAIEATIEDSGKDIGDFDQYNAHAAGTLAGDPEETEGLKMAFGAFAPRLHISTPKSTFTHMQGPAGASAVFKTLMEMKNRVIYKNPNQEYPMEEAEGLNLQRETKTADIRLSLIMGIGINGPNAGLVLEKITA